MLCCLALAGLAVFGPHGVKLYRMVTKGRRPHQPTHRPVERVFSQHLVQTSPVGRTSK